MFQSKKMSMEKNVTINNVQSFVMNQNIFVVGTKIVTDARSPIYVYLKTHLLQPMIIALEHALKIVTLTKYSAVDQKIVKLVVSVLIGAFQRIKMSMETSVRTILRPMDVLLNVVVTTSLVK